MFICGPLLIASQPHYTGGVQGIPIAKIVNATVIPLDQAPSGYQEFDKGAPRKFVLDPHGIIAKAA